MFFKEKLKVPPHHLPAPEGAYTTGCTDVMTEYGVNSLFFRMYYPSNLDATEFKKHHDRWVYWNPKDTMTIKGFAAFLHLWTFFLRFLMWLFGKETYIPTLWEQPLSTKIKKMPIVLFSHGYGATKYLYSTVCNELASRGCLVASIEHKDHSACITHYYESKEQMERDERTYILHKPVNNKLLYQSIHERLQHRSSECIRVLNWLEEANNGNATNIFPTKFNVNSLKGTLDFCNIIIMGHSFGGSTAMYTLSKDERFKAGIMLDGWMFPIKNETLDIPQPMLFINSMTFQIKSNIEIMKKYCNLKNNLIYTIRNTTHECHSDTAFVYGYWLNIFVKKLSAGIALRIQNHLIMDFLHKHIHGIDFDEEQTRTYLDKQRHNIVQDFILYSKKKYAKVSIF